jgi:DNA-directed RNA polymerase specialized sigma24 family protein
MTQKRGGGRVVPLGEQDVASPVEDDVFDREWVAHLLEVALGRLAREHPTYHDALRLAVLEGRSRAEVAAALGRSEGDVNNHLHRGKGKLIEYIREQVRDYSTTQSGYEEELRYLARLLPRA